MGICSIGGLIITITKLGFDSFCVVGTDTAVGKTRVTGLLAHYFSKNKISTITQKWIQCGDLDQPDIYQHDFWGSVPHKTNDARQVYSFPLSASPHLAAKQHQEDISVPFIKDQWVKLKRQHKMVIVEGSGGLLVPISKTKTFLDLIQSIGIPVLLVVPNQLGCINHALLSCESIQSRNIKCLGLVFNRLSDTVDPLIQLDNPTIISQLNPFPILGSLPFTSDRSQLIDSVSQIGDKIMMTVYSNPKMIIKKQ